MDTNSPNLGFYQAAAGLLAVLLLTGTISEVRAARDRHDDASSVEPPQLVTLYAYLDHMGCRSVRPSR